MNTDTREREIRFKVGYKRVGGIYWQILDIDEIRRGLVAWENKRKPDYYLEWIGLQDKNKNPVYEGDIVKVKGMKRVGEYITEIIYDGCGFKLKTNKTYLKDYYLPKNMIEVIGNIYETPQLIQK